MNTISGLETGSITQPPVSIVIPFAGNTSELKRCLASIRQQIYTSLEVIVVVDNPSSARVPIDGQLIRETPVKVLQNEANFGPFASRIIGAREASGKYLSFIDHDDALDANYISTLVGEAEKHGAEIVECPIRQYDAEGRVRLHTRVKSSGLLYGPEILLNYLNGRSHNGLVNKLIRKAIWDRTMEVIRDHTRKLTFAEDLLCTLNMFNIAQLYVSTIDTSYRYCYRKTSVTRLSNQSVVAESLRSLCFVVKEITPLISACKGYQSSLAFIDRELVWALSFLLSRIEPFDGMKTLSDCVSDNIGLLRSDVLAKFS